MTSFFEKRDRWGNGLALWVLVLLVFVAPLAYMSLKNTRLKNDIENWLPAEDEQSVTLQWYLAHFSQEDRVLVSWEGSSLSDPRIVRFTEKLEGRPGEDGRRRGGSPYVAKVATPHEVLQRMVDADIEQDEAVRRLTGVLIGSGTLKVRLTETGRESRERTIQILQRQARAELGIELNVSDPAMEWEDLAAADFDESFDFEDELFEDSDETVDEELDVAALDFEPIPEHDLQLHWQGMQPESETAQQLQLLALSLREAEFGDGFEGESLIESCFFHSGSPVALSVSVSEVGEADMHATLDAIRAAGEEAGIAPEMLHLGGRPVARAALNREVKRAAWNRAEPLTMLHKRSVILLSGLVGIVLAFVLLRSGRLATLVLLVSGYTVYLTLSLVPLTGGNMNMVLVVMPTLLYVLALSGAVHVANYWKHAANADLPSAIVRATKMARLPCTLASVTTAIGLLSLTTSPLAPVRDFGLYSAVGCLLALVMVLYALPSLLQFWPAKAPAHEEVDAEGWMNLGRFLARFHVPVTIISLVVFAVSAYGLKYFRTETKVIRYFPDESRVVQDYRFLEESLAGIVPVEVVVRFDEQAQSEMGFLDRLELVRAVQEKVRQHPEISGTLSLADFQPVVEQPAEDAGLLTHRRYNSRAMLAEQRIKEERKDEVKSLFVVADEPADLAREGDGRLNNAGDELWRITAQVAIMSDLDYGQLTADLDDVARSSLKLHAGSSHVVTGMVPLFLRTQQAVLDSLIQSFSLAFAMIAVVMMIVLRNPVAGAVTMLPNLLPVGVVFGLISWAGLRVDIGTMITASVALGIAVDGTLHLLTWFKDGIAQGANRVDAVAAALGHCGPAMWQTSMMVGIGLLMLYPADLLLIGRFGWLMAALIGVALIADVILLPALLAGPLGALIQKRTPLARPVKPVQPKTVPSDPHLKIIASDMGRSLRVDP